MINFKIYYYPNSLFLIPNIIINYNYEIKHLTINIVIFDYLLFFDINFNINFNI